MSDLTVHTRKDWRAAKRTGSLERRAYSSITDFVIHWPGDNPRSWRNVNTRAEEAATWRSFQRQHMHDNGWRDVGYNLGMGNGGFDAVPRVWTLRGVLYTPASQLRANTNTMSLVVLVGPSDPITQNIIRRIRSVVRWAEDLTGNNLKVRGHDHYTSTDCPGAQLRHLIRSGRFNV